MSKVTTKAQKSRIAKIQKENESLARTSSLSIIYHDIAKKKKKNVSRSILGSLISLSYTDSCEDASDTLSINLEDKARKWIDAWMPNDKDIITAKIITKNWITAGDSKTFSCGDFVVDEFTANGEPITLDIGGISGPVGDSFRETSRHKVWKKTTVKAIASAIAKRYGMKLSYDAISISIASVEQQDNDSSFLASLCETYGLTMKVYKAKLVLFGRERYKAKGTVRTIDVPTMCESWSYAKASSRKYTGGTIIYKIGKSSKKHRLTIGTKSNLLKLDDTASSLADARHRIKAAVNKENHSLETLDLTLMGDMKLVGGATVKITGLGKKINGKYYINSAEHRVDSGGYSVSISISKVGTAL
jgi:phage protein D